MCWSTRQWPLLLLFNLHGAPKTAMAKQSKSKSKKKQSAPKAERGSLADRTAASPIFKAFTALLVVAFATTWLLARPALERRVAAHHTFEELDVRFDWPMTDDDRGSTWLPEPVQRLMHDIATSNISSDPFNQTSLEAARQDLDATGWFSDIKRVHRKPGGVIEITAQWRTPAAVVRYKSTDYLVARGGEVLRLPPTTPVAEGSMPLILSPMAEPPGVDAGGIIFGKPWVGGDVQASIRLIETLRADHDFDRVIGVELAGYLQTGHLTLLTDAGCRIVWGSAIGEVAPGEVPIEKKLANLRDILSQRLDARHQRIEIYPPVVLIDKTSRP